MEKPEILQLARYPAFTQEELEQHFTPIKLFEAEDPDAVIEAKAANIRGIASGGEVKLDEGLMGRLPNLEIISVFGVGYDGVDVATAKARNIVVTNTPDVLSKEVADFAIAMLLGQMRRIPQGDAYVRSGEWSKAPPPLARRAWGRRVGILGMGRIGQEILRRCEAFEMELAYCARSRKPEIEYEFHSDPVSLAAWAEILIVIIPGGPETRAIINREVLDALGPEGLLVNVSRGSTIDEDALIEALESGRLGGAALDVFLNEPNPDPRFRKLENVLLQPHTASGTVETRTAMGKLMIENLREWFSNGSALTPVT